MPALNKVGCLFRRNSVASPRRRGRVRRSFNELHHCQTDLEADAGPVAAYGRGYSRSGDGWLKRSPGKIYNPSPAKAVGFFFAHRTAGAGKIMKTKTAIPDAPERHAPLWLVVAAFAAVYIIWGSTYLAIRYAVESIPPFLMAGARHLAAGLALFAFARSRGAGPTLAQWRDAVIAGALLLVIGNGGVTWAEQKVPSATAALLVALVPLWMVLFDWLRPGGVRPGAWVGAGLAAGIAGVALLARGHGEHHEASYGWSVAVLLAASIGWSFGSIFNRHARKPSSPFMAVALQMIAGGVILLALGGTQGEFQQFKLAQVTALSFGCWLYLTVAGSLIAYTAYVWLLHASTPARVATYAYVNPLIAVLLGCTLGHEVFTHELLVAGALIIIAVALIVRGGSSTKAKTSAQPSAPTPAASISE